MTSNPRGTARVPRLVHEHRSGKWCVLRCEHFLPASHDPAPMMDVFRVTAWLAVAFCIFRGLPVIISSLRRYWGIPSAVQAS